MAINLLISKVGLPFGWGWGGMEGKGGGVGREGGRGNDQSQRENDRRGDRGSSFVLSVAQKIRYVNLAIN